MRQFKICLITIVATLIALPSSLILSPATAKAGDPCDPATANNSESITEFVLPDGICPQNITVGNNGLIWFTSNKTNDIGRIEADGSVTLFKINESNSSAGQNCFIKGSDNNIWFDYWSNDYSNQQLGKIDPNGDITYFDHGTVDGYVGSCALGSDGKIWMSTVKYSEESQWLGATITKITPDGSTTEYDPGQPGMTTYYTSALTLGPGGDIWFYLSDEDSNRQIVRMNNQGEMESYIWNNSQYPKMFWGTSDKVWFCTEGSVGIISSSGEISTFNLENESEYIKGIAEGADGAGWFTMSDANKIGRVNTNGDITTTDIQTPNSFPYGITADQNGNIWYGLIAYQKIVRINLALSDNSDSDPIADSVENNAPNNGDGNNDGTPDSQQPNVTSLPLPSGKNQGTYITLVTPAGTTITTTAIQQATALATQDPSFDYPLGLIAFTATNLTPGSTIPIELYYYTDQSPDSFIPRKYNSTTNAYTTLSTQTNTTLTQTTINTTKAIKLTYDITDGGDLDQDSLVNGTIVDPVGLAQTKATAPNTGIPTYWLMSVKG